MVVGGSKQYIGAPALAGRAAYRTGAGLVTLAVPQSIQGMVAGDFLEATWFPLSDERGYLGEAGADALRHSETAYDAACIGVGLGWNDTTLAFMARLLADDSLFANVRNLVIDADGLNLLSEIADWHGSLPKGTIITPHPGEMARLTGLKIGEIESDRIGIARQMATDKGCVTVLKGPYTVVAAPDGRASISPFATDALAKAGTGDVLTGIILGLLAGGMAPFEAAKAGVYLHAYTAVRNITGRSSRSLLAGEIVEDLPIVLNDFTK